MESGSETQNLKFNIQNYIFAFSAVKMFYLIQGLGEQAAVFADQFALVAEQFEHA